MIFVYRYITYQDKNSATQTSYILLNSVVISFVLKTVYDATIKCVLTPPPKEGELPYLIPLLVFCILCGFILSKVIPSACVKKIRKILGISRTPHGNIWDDIMEPGLWIRVWLNDSNKSYLGQIKYVENYEREPIVVLEYYQFIGEDNEILVDNSQKPERTVMLNTQGFERIELVGKCM